MKLEFFIESIDHLDDSQYVVITTSNRMNASKNIINLYNPNVQEIFNAINKKFIESFKTYFLISIEKCKTENFMVGDRIEADVIVKNTGEITP